jgi:RNA-directed DNA polymerase
VNDKTTHSFARPEEEDIRQGEGRTNLALLGTLRPRLQDGTLREAYQIAKNNKGAPGIDGVTFDAIEESGVESFLKQIQDELVHNTYRPMPVRKKEIPKDGGSKVRVLSIPAIRDRVVQGALKLILEPIFEADFQSGSYGYRPKRSAHEAVDRVAQGIVQGLTRIIDLDLRAYFGAPG